MEIPCAVATKTQLLEYDLTEHILRAAIEVHRQLGPGLLESVYEECLCRELQLQGIYFARQVEMPLLYKGQPVESGLRLDLLVEDKVIVEIKAIDKLVAVHDAQLLTYLKLTGKRVGLLINFNVVLLKDGIHRKVL